MKTTRFLIAILICAGLITAGLAEAASIPAKINYQGVLKDAAGAKVDGTVDIDLRLLPLGGGAEVFSESHAGVSVVGGLFSLKIGGVNDMSAVSFDTAYELELTVDGDLLSPNTPLCSAPYALGVVGGAQGPQGKQGPAGSDGSAGSDGGAGAVGATGAQGPQGKQGDAGPVGSEFWDANGNDIYNTNSGNVGIGVTPPAIHSAVTNISLGGNATISGDKAPSAGAVLDIAQNVYFNTGATWTKLSNDESSRYNQGGGAHKFYTAPSGAGAAAESLVMVLTNDGNVGIGTDNPGGVKLDVVGDLRVRKLDGGGSPSLSVSRHAGARVVLEAGSTIGYMGTGNGFPIALLAGNSEKIRITTSGNIGIGTTSPEHTLHIFKGSAGSVDAHSFSGLVLEDDAGLFQTFLVPANQDSGFFFGDSDSATVGGLYYEHALDKMNFRTHQIRAMSIDSSGNVGIGTSNPEDTLHVVKDGGWGPAIFSLAGDNSNPSVALFRKSRGTHASPSAVQDGDNITTFVGQAYNGVEYKNSGAIDIRVDGTFSSGQRPPSKIQFQTTEAGGGLTARMTIKGNGNVGIGTDSPGNLLALEGSKPQLFLNTGGTDSTTLGSGYGEFTLNTASGVDINIKSAGNTKMMIKGVSGNVGVGTTSPSEKLHVAGNILADGGLTRSITAKANTIMMSMVADDALLGPYITWGVGAAMKIKHTDGAGTITNVATFQSNGILSVTGLVETSDRNEKQNIQTVDNALDKVMNMRGVNFEWKQNAAETRSTDTQLGFVAQELEEVLPEVVMTNEDGLKSVSYSHVTAVLVEAVKEQQATIEALKAEVESLKNQNN